MRRVPSDDSEYPVRIPMPVSEWEEIKPDMQEKRVLNDVEVKVPFELPEGWKMLKGVNLCK